MCLFELLSWHPHLGPVLGCASFWLFLAERLGDLHSGICPSWNQSILMPQGPYRSLRQSDPTCLAWVGVTLAAEGHRCHIPMAFGVFI